MIHVNVMPHLGDNWCLVIYESDERGMRIFQGETGNWGPWLSSGSDWDRPTIKIKWPPMKHHEMNRAIRAACADALVSVEVRA